MQNEMAFENMKNDDDTIITLVDIITRKRQRPTVHCVR